MSIEKGHTIKVLDHGYVKYVDHMGSDEAIVEAARMSTGKGFVDWEAVKECTKCGLRFPLHQTVLGYACADGVERPGEGVHDWRALPGDRKLLEFMYKNKHATPFEFGVLHIEMQAPIMVFREWHRHRTHAYSEFSARYSQMPNLHYQPDPTRVQKQSMTNRQGSGEAFDELEARQIVETLAAEQQAVYTNYDVLCGRGVAKEIARINTPVARYSRQRDICNLRNWLAFLILRKQSKHSNPQWEIAQYANAVGEIVDAIWPRTYALFEEYDLFGVHLSRSEAALLREFIDDVRTTSEKLNEDGVLHNRKRLTLPTALLEKLA